MNEWFSPPREEWHSSEVIWEYSVVDFSNTWSGLTLSWAWWLSSFFFEVKLSHYDRKVIKRYWQPGSEVSKLMLCKSMRKSPMKKAALCNWSVVNRPQCSCWGERSSRIQCEDTFVGYSLNPSLLLLLNPSLCAGCRVKPNQPKHQSWEQRKFNTRAKQGERATCTQKTQAPWWHSGKSWMVEDRVRGEGHRTHDQLLDFLLIGWWWDNRVMFQGSQLSGSNQSGV